uniref:Meteorin, glial cell differentiation regulator n=1 Tax=Pelusios castaneus TaxID=367368 RepID=A0A8C8RJB9_9SAUR
MSPELWGVNFTEKVWAQSTEKNWAQVSSLKGAEAASPPAAGPLHPGRTGQEVSRPPYGGGGTPSQLSANVDLFSSHSGLSQESGSVEQISLHCAEGSLEWLYPAGALRLSLSPRLPMSMAYKGKSPRQVIACIKPSSSFGGAQIYLERDGILKLLLSEAEVSLHSKVRCFSWLPKKKVALFLQSTLHQDISRRIAAFRYEPVYSGQQGLHSSTLVASCGPEVIVSVLPLFPLVIRGNIRTVSNDVEMQESIINVSATRIHRQKFTLFQPLGKSSKPMGSIRTLLRCGVKPGPGSFLFTGWLHFGEAWLSCAPRYKDFRRIYEDARQAHENPCEVSLD